MSSRAMTWERTCGAYLAVFEKAIAAHAQNRLLLAAAE
jgi:hypothetical protein